MALEIREERQEDLAAIRVVNEQAFGQPQEALLVDRLRENGGVLLSLVAADAGSVLGHILYSPVRLGSGAEEIQGAGLGPMSVLPGSQRRGIGSALVEEGNRRLRDAGCPFVVVLGHPEYYPRFGFVPASRFGVRSPWEVPEEVFLLLPLHREKLGSTSGLARYREEFSLVS